ncbi:polyprenol reductase 2 isoform X1 [Gossypium hirsutum]|uniref:Polyprenol reductase 2 isoform X1 n=1 Tax=Gossypium hirsutum TaxID=3635 RepID=A0ABM2ZH81_GOSHI|nr:polyprenol reductase 2-like isoform X1 [Gossypium hirsutum]
MEVGLVALLRLTWVAAILPIILASLRLRPFHQTILGLAKRGKTMHPSSSKFTVPQRFFSHFYMVGTLWTTLLLLTTWLYACTAGSTSSTIFALHKSHRVWRALFLLWLMEAQVLRRLYESLYVFHYRPLARMHIFGYFIGMSYYIVASLSLCCTCAPEVFEFTLDLVSEGRKQWQPLEVIGGNRSPLWLGWKQWVGSAIFLWGWIHQLRILGSMRAGGEEYVIPKGDWFEIVSSPHYLAEIVIYVGLLIASGGADITIWLLLAFVVTNLGFAAAETQKWYIGKFEDYPKHRYAMIPFIF